MKVRQFVAQNWHILAILRMLFHPHSHETFLETRRHSLAIVIRGVYTSDDHDMALPECRLYKRSTQLPTERDQKFNMHTESQDLPESRRTDRLVFLCPVVI